MTRDEALEILHKHYPEYSVKMAVKFKGKYIFTPKDDFMRRIPPLSVDSDGKIETFSPLNNEYNEYANFLEKHLKHAKNK